MRKLKKLAALFIAAALTLSMSTTAFAALDDTGYADVDANAWYADAVVYCRDNGLMNGTSDTAFSPDETMTRAMLATVLYRLAESPAVSGSDSFTDTVEDSWYSPAVLWAAQNGIVTGYGDGLFGTDDPVTREQIAAIMWRYAGSPAAESGTDFADEDSISTYAAQAVDWAQAVGIINGVGGNRFDPQANADRAQVATILMHYVRVTQSEPTPDPEPDDSSAGTLVAYFSCTGNTETVAGQLSEILGADLYEIVPEVPYTSADLDYNTSDSRANQEMNDSTARPAISGSVENMDEYDTVFLGYPIWWGQAPRIISTFLESYDFTGKTIVPFCTSGSSSIGSSATNLHTLASDATWLDGQRFSGSTSRDTLADWVDSLGLTTSAD